jgi:YD repeat-containing protein
MGCTNSPIGYANPDAVTQVGNGLSTSTYSYDNDGNLAQKTTDGVTTTYVYDYANRLIALGAQGATTTYGYDAFGQRVIQTDTSTTGATFERRCKTAGDRSVRPTATDFAGSGLPGIS